MSLPVILDWTQTRTTLHQAAQVIGAIRVAVVDPEPNYAHLGLRPVPTGVTTGVLPEWGEFELDFKTQTILFQPLDRDGVGFSLARHTQVSLADSIMQALASLGYTVTLDRAKIQGTTPFEINPRDAATYADALYMLFTTFERFRDGLPGEKSPLIVWPHGFDLSFLWFATDKALESEPHMSFGFSPNSEGFDRPYIYAYLYPIPEGLTDHALPALARWITDPWTGVVIAYDDLVRYDQALDVLETTLEQLYEALAPLLE